MKKNLYILLCLMLLTACQKGRTYFPKDLEPQTVELVRFDKALMNVQTKGEGLPMTGDGESSIKVDIRVLYETYPDFMPLWGKIS